jgi:small subunit ribosomal protein S6
MEVILRKYETLMIIRPSLEEDEVKAVLDDISALIAREGGTINGVDIWGMRRLEYPIKREESGHYAVVNFSSEAGVVKELERVTGIRDDVLRVKTVVLEGK